MPNIQYSKGDKVIGESRVKGNAWIREWNEKQAARSKPVYIIFGGIGICALLVVIINYVKFIYYFIYLFT